MTAHLGRVETYECLVVTSARREYVLVTYTVMSTSGEARC
jgi:hypothetical protein